MKSNVNFRENARLKGWRSLKSPFVSSMMYSHYNQQWAHTWFTFNIMLFKWKVYTHGNFSKTNVKSFGLEHEVWEKNIFFTNKFESEKGFFRHLEAPNSLQHFLFVFLSLFSCNFTDWAQIFIGLLFVCMCWGHIKWRYSTLPLNRSFTN